MCYNEDILNLGYYLNHAFTALTYRLNQALRESGIPMNHSHFEVFQALSRSRSGVMSQSEISNELGKDPAAISRTVNYLETQGFVYRKAVSGCKFEVALTGKALELIPKIEMIIREVISGVCSDIPDENILNTISFLVHIYEKCKNN